MVRKEYLQLTDRIAGILKELTTIVAQQPECQFLMSIPRIGVINATAIYSAIGSITKRGDRYLRKQLVHGARALLYRCRNKTDRLSRWANALIERRGYNKACVAMAARLARLCWVVLLQKKEMYREK